MKRKDLIIISLAVLLGALFSIGVSKIFIRGEGSLKTVEIVQPISAEFPLPDNKYFNPLAFDPTQIIKIQDNDNKAPFDGTKQP